jgi:polyphenol oxidase
MPVETIIEKAKNGEERANPHEAELQEQDLILNERGFYWRERDGVRVLISSALEVAGFVNGFSTRLGGVSPFPSGDLNLAGYDEDDSENIEENRRRFLSVFDGEFSLSTVWQIHSNKVKVIRTRKDAVATDEKADALAASIRGLLIGVKTADCVPILVCDPKTGAYAAIHAGWRGTVGSIASIGVDTLVREFGSAPRDMIAAIGPAACGRNYEVGPEVVAEFDQRFSTKGKYFSPTENGHALVDLHLANKDQLKAAGLSPEGIYIAPFCTMERTDLFFSYRVEKKRYGKTGRLLSVIGRKG